MFAFKRPILLIHRLAPARGKNVRFMATEKELKMRIASVRSIQKITKASKMVAAAKMRGAENMLAIGRPFSAPMKKIWKTDEQIAEEEKMQKQSADIPDHINDGKTLIVPITSDRGLCGGINSAVVKQARNIIAAAPANAVIDILMLGERGRSIMHRVNGHKFTMALVDASKSVVPTFDLACSVANMYLEHQFDDSIFIWNKFRSAIAYSTTKTHIPSFANRMKSLESLALYEFDDNEDEVLRNLHEFTAATEFYHFFLESNTTEQSQKMSAMENSTKNAGELIDKLSIQYNRSRQARITTELIEIISGASALE